MHQSVNFDHTQEIVLDIETVGDDDLSFREHINAINNEIRRARADMELSLDNSLSVIAPNILKAAKSGSQKEFLTSFCVMANTDGTI
ncbi:hypothetical protein GJAV_G00155740 [Gymnothorax javanicus]|nr:hypothetical protein GJAV_G00155740 [Gymnothorax javanicus]